MPRRPPAALLLLLARLLGGRAMGARRPVLLVTDIGRDVDDSLAMLTVNGLRQAGDVDLVGVIATGGAGEVRARVARGWLRRFGIPDGEMPVAADGLPGRPQCFVPAGTPQLEDAALYEPGPAALLLELVQKFAGRLEAFAIAPVSPLALAIKDSAERRQLVRAGLKALHIQGQCRVEAGRLVPDFSAFNLEEDREASELVFAELQDFVPFHFLGKHAAYQVGLHRSDFEAWDALLGGSEMVQMAKNNLNIFRQGNPSRFYILYDVPKEFQNDADWFDHLSVLSHPYDPLLLVAAFRPELFRHIPMPTSRAPAGDSAAAAPEHTAIGNTAEDGSVLDPHAIHGVLSRLIYGGVETMRSDAH